MNLIKNNKFIILSILCIIIFCIGVTPITLQNDTFYSVKIGEYVLQNGITMQDPFSWHDGLPYEYPHWGYDVMMYLIYNVGGWNGIYISTIIFACILGLSIYAVNRKLTKNNVTSFIITIMTMYMLRGYIAARAQLVTFILFILTIYFIEKFLETAKKRYAIPLILIPIIIANIHVAVFPFYFVLYLPYIGEYVIHNLLNIDNLFYKIKMNKLNKKKDKANEQEKKNIEDTIRKMQARRIAREEKNNKIQANPYKIKVDISKNIKYLILIMIICIFTGLITPTGTTPYTYLYDTMRGNTPQNINEHLPLTLMEHKDFLLTIVLFLAIITFTDVKIKLRDLLMLSGLLFLAFQSNRQISMFVLICSVILNKLICQIIDKYDNGRCEKLEKICMQFPMYILITCVTIFTSASILKPNTERPIVDDVTYPVYAAEFILNNLDTQNIRIYNEYNYGSYLLFRGIPVFIDSRADLYAPEFNGGRDIFTDFLNISGLNEDYKKKFDEYGITHAIMYQSSKLSLLLKEDEDYRVIYDKDFIIYERVKGEANEY